MLRRSRLTPVDRQDVHVEVEVGHYENAGQATGGEEQVGDPAAGER